MILQKRFYVKYNYLIFSLVKTGFLSSILNLKNAKHLYRGILKYGESFAC